MSPAGLDGNPDPIVTPARTEMLAVVAASVAALPPGRRIVALDGIDGAGKTTLADELARSVGALTDRAVVRATIDSFHRPRAERYARGRQSGEGFYRDSHDLPALRARLLDPFRAGGTFRRAAFDEPTDLPVVSPLEDAPADAVLLFDGLFLQRAELAGRWDLVVYVDGRRRVADGRIARVTADCPVDPVAAFVHVVAWCARLVRYVDGQARYHAECDPVAGADLVIGNDDLAAPVVRVSRRTA
jgi:uridine kinase